MTTLGAQGGPQTGAPAPDDVDMVRDRELVNRAQAGDRSAFEDLYARYYQDAASTRG